MPNAPAIRIVAGLGNPGARYHLTRHNLGFLTLDHLATREGWRWNREKRWQADIAKSPDGALWLVKPQTFMNCSGESVAPLARFLRIPPEAVLAVIDDLELPWGRLRIRASGSAGGHNGLRSLITHLGSSSFPRLRLGIGRPGDNDPRDPVDHVLGTFSSAEQTTLANVLERATVAILAIHRQGLDAAMNDFNRDPSTPPRRQASGPAPQLSPPPSKDTPTQHEA